MTQPTTHHRDRGQATVELALAMPLVCLLLCAVVQVVEIGRDQLAVQLAAREAARAASVAADPVAAGNTAAHRAVALRPLEVQITTAGGVVTATVRYRNTTDVAFVGALLPEVTLSASVAMALEPP